MNREEYEVLAGKDSFIKSLYVFAIRRYMDYATGTVGIKRGISYQSLAEEMYIEPTRGVKRTKHCKDNKPTIKQIRRGVETLEKIGLLKRIPAKRKLIFQCILATSNKSVQKQLGCNWADQEGRESDTQNHQQHIEKQDNSIESPQQLDSKLGRPKIAQLGTPLLSVVKKKKDITNVISKKEKVSPVIPDWICKEDWEAFIEHRKALRAPMSNVAQARAINELKRLSELGHKPSEVINQSIINGWKGLFEVSNRQGDRGYGNNRILPGSGSSAFERATANAFRIIKH